MRYRITPETLAQVATMALSEPDLVRSRFNLFMKGFVDEISRPANNTPQRVALMIQDEPAELPFAPFNAFLAGAAEVLAQRQDIAVPDWALAESRFLPRPAFWGSRPQTRSYMLVETPGPFRRRNLFCGYVRLHSNRWSNASGASPSGAGLSGASLSGTNPT